MTTPYQEKVIAAPLLNAENQAYFDAAGEGRLLVKHCKACGSYHHYPRALCPFCHSDDVHWSESPGTGVIYTLTVTRRAGPIPYALAYVTLDKEGISMMTNIVDCDLDALRIGHKVRVVFRQSESGTAVPMFTPA